MKTRIFISFVCLCCALAASAQPELTQPDPLQEVNRLIEQLKTEPEAYKRAAAADRLGSLGFREAVPPLIAALQDDNQVATSAAKALGLLGDLRAVPALLAVLDLTKEGKLNANRDFLQALIALGDPAMKERLTAMLGEKWTPYCLVLALTGLEKLNDAGVADAVLPLIGNEQAGVSARAMLVAARLDDQRAIPLIVPRLRDRNLLVRRTAVEAISLLLSRMAIESKKELQAGPAAAAIEPLKALLADPDPLLRALAVRALGEFDMAYFFYNEPAELPECIAKSLDDADAVVRAEAVSALAGFDTNDVIVPRLVDALRDDDPGVRATAAEALYNFSEGIAGMKALLAADVPPDTRAAAVKALGAARRDEATPAVIAALRDPDSSVRAAAAAAFPNVIEGLHNSLPPVRMAALETALRDVMPLLADEIPDVRARAAEALGRLCAAARSDMMLSILMAPEGTEVRKQTVEALAAAAGDRSPIVRRWAVWALGECPGKLPPGLIRAALVDPDPAVRREAARIAAEREMEG